LATFRPLFLQLFFENTNLQVQLGYMKYETKKEID
jgi:hypothetical protein